MPAKTPNLTKTQAAWITGVTARHFHSIVANGKGPPLELDKTINPKVFGEWLRERISGEQIESGDGGFIDFEYERAKLTQKQASLKELELLEAQGVLVNAQEVEDVWSSAVLGLRAKLLSLPVKLAPKVLGVTDIRDIEEFARQIIYEALEEMHAESIEEDPDDLEPVAEEAGATASDYGISVGSSGKDAVA